MPEIAYKDNHAGYAHEHKPQAETFGIIRDIDANVRDFANELYVFKRETIRRLEAVEQTQEKHSLILAELKQDNAVLKNYVAELKDSVKELRRDISDIKGDIKALAAGFGVAQNRFNWGLVIIGIIVALIQMLK